MSGSDGVRRGHKGLYWFGPKYPTSSVVLLMLLAQVCSRDYKRAREEEGPQSLIGVSGRLNRVELRESPSAGCPPFPFIGQGEWAGSKGEREIEREREGRRDPAVLLRVWVLPILLMMMEASARRAPVRQAM